MKKYLFSCIVFVFSISILGCEKSNSNLNLISENKAKKIALKDSKITEDKVEQLRIHEEIDDGISVFDIDFNTKDSKYEYIISTKTGKIIDKSIEQKQWIVSDKEKSIIIDSNKAEVIALQDAGVVDKETIQVNVKEEFEDSLKVYEVRFKTKDKEYEYTIDVSGNILDKSTDTIDE